MDETFSSQPISSPSEAQEAYALPQPNPVTQAIHHREVFQQISLPLGIMSLILVAVAVLLIFSERGTASLWADIALIFLIIIAAILTLIIFVVLLAITYGVFKAVSVLPPYSRVVQDIFWLIRSKTTVFADKSIEPILTVNGWKAGAKVLTQNLKGGKVNNDR